MGDIRFSHPFDLEPGWRVIAQNPHHQLAILESPSPYAADVQQFGDIVVAVLSNDVKATDIIEAVRLHREHFVEGMRLRKPAAGLIWNKTTDECCIFRDIWGFVVWGISRIHNDIECTTSPEIFGQMVRGRPLNHARIASYLRQTEDDFRFDFFEHTERILPGECLILARDCSAFFEAVLRNGDSEAIEKAVGIHRISYWDNRRYCSFDASYEELVPELRKTLVDASSRIGACEDLCFTLSGGLDSSGVLSAYCALLKDSGNKKFDAMSLISRQHSSCDESRELDVLESALPIRLMRVNMDEAWTFSKPELYGKYWAWGPMGSPGIEVNLLGYQAVAKTLGARTIITGYGGNFIVKVRFEAMLRHILRQGKCSDWIDAVKNLDRGTIRFLLARTAANTFDGRIYALYRRLSTAPHQCDIESQCMSPWFYAQFGSNRIDPVFSMSHLQERAWIPKSWDWEFAVRCLDKLARLTPHRFYDPLLDPVLYDFCAQIPPQFFERNGEYRKIYKDALAPLLPAAIISHPKCQSFDDMSHEGLAKHASPYVENRILSCCHDCIQKQNLLELYRKYLEHVGAKSSPYNLNNTWRPISLCFWNP